MVPTRAAAKIIPAKLELIHSLHSKQMSFDDEATFNSAKDRSGL